MLKVKINIVQGCKEVDIPFTILSKKEDSKNIAILLPGAGYTVQAPLLQ